MLRRDSEGGGKVKGRGGAERILKKLKEKAHSFCFAFANWRK